MNTSNSPEFVINLDSLKFDDNGALVLDEELQLLVDQTSQEPLVADDFDLMQEVC